MTPRLRIGARLRAEFGSEMVDFTDLQQALLLLLADAGTSGMSRDRVAELLWVREAGATSPRRRLRQLIYGTNRRSGIDMAVGDSNAVRLGTDVTPIWTGEDAGVEIVPPTKAFATVRQEIADRSWNRSREDVLSSVDHARLTDDPELILELLTADSNPDSLWRDGVWALLRSGRVREAESAFARFGVTDTETMERCRVALGRLLSGTAPWPEVDRADVPLVGRADVIAETVRAIGAGDRRVVLTGPSGVGLTRTLGSVSAWILSEMDDLVVASATCSNSGRSIAYDTLNRLFDSELFRAAHLEVDEPWRSVIARVLRVFDRSPGVDIEPLEGTAASLRVLHGISHLILKAIGNAQLVAVVDDLHLADPASLTVLTHLCVEGEGAVIRLLGAVRTDTELQDPVQHLVAAEATVVAVPPLGPDESRHLLATARPDLGPEVIDTVTALADGYPRRIFEASRSIDEGADSLQGGTLAELLRVRLQGLTAAEQEVLALLSVAPDGLSAELLMGAVGLGVLDLGRALASLEARAVVESGPEARIRSGFLRRQIRAGLPSSIQAALHRSIARELQHLEPVQSSSVGRHLSEAGDHGDATEWLIRGAHEAADAEAFPVAIDLMTRAVSGVGPDAIGWERLDFAGGLCVAEGRFDEAADFFGHSVRVGEIADVDEQRLLGVRLREVTALSECRFGEDRPVDQAWVLLRKARELGDLDAEARALDVLFRIADFNLDFDLTWAALEELKRARAREEVSPYLDWVEVRRAYIDDSEAARKAALRFYEFSEPGSADRLMALGRNVANGVLRGQPGDQQVRDALSELRAMNRTIDPLLRAQIMINASTWHLERDSLEEARDFALRSQLVSRNAQGDLRWNQLNNLSEVSIRTGEIGVALGTYAQAPEARNPSPWNEFQRDAMLAWAHVEAGQLAAAKSLVERWLHVQFVQPLPAVIEAALEARLRTLSVLGESARAKAHLDEAITRFGGLQMSRALERANELGKRLRLMTPA